MGKNGMTREEILKRIEHYLAYEDIDALIVEIMQLRAEAYEEGFEESTQQHKLPDGPFSK